MPLNEFVCEDCGARIERLHAVGKPPGTCGLDCRREGPGAFGKGQLRPVLAAPQIVTSRKGPAGPMPSFGEVHREAMRQKGLRKLGGELRERDLDTLRDKGMTVYRRDGSAGWAKDGGDSAAPDAIKKPRDA